MSIHEYKKNSGEVCYRVMFRVNGKSTTRRGFRTKTEAKRYENSILTQRDSGKAITSPKLTVKEYLNEWYRTARNNNEVGENHYKRMGIHVNNLIELLGHIRVTELKPLDFVALRTEWRERWAERTIKAMEITLKAAMLAKARE